MATSIYLSKITKVDFRDCWQNEATDFTPWLATEENMSLLADALKNEAETAMGETFDWRRLDSKKTSTVDLFKKCDFTKKSSQTELFEWLKEYTERFVSFFKPIIKKL